jgi:hypothetical protein
MEKGKIFGSSSDNVNNNAALFSHVITEKYTIISLRR